MYKHIIAATDGLELSKKGVDQALALAKSVGARVTIATVTEPWTAVAYGEMPMDFPIDAYEKNAAGNAERILAAARAVAEKAGVACETVHIKDQYPAEGLIGAAKQRGCDLIVMSSHGRRGLSRLMLGSQAHRVVTMSTLPVLICR
jgi:nucleotide-binding universal stress UspA family protein